VEESIPVASAVPTNGTEVNVLAEVTFKIVYQYDDDASLERHTKEAEDLTRRALAGHAAMYDVEVLERKAPIDSFPASE
jgi:hypothetical protein